MQIDLHVHSKHSKRPSQWILKKIGCPESFTEPLELYAIARRRGMTHVTISDHNTIDGALEIAHLPDTFVSEEATSYFPEDGCKLHVLALDITEDQHREIQRLRQNVYDLVTYFRQEQIFNIIAHPLYAVNDRLTIDHFEKLLLLFRNFELNGARNSRENLTLKSLLNQLTPSDIERLADRHGITPGFARAHEKRLFGGSDDHSALNIARTYTEFIGADDQTTRLAVMQDRRVAVHGIAPSPQTMAHNLYGIAWQFFRRKFNLGRYVGKDPLIRFLDSSLTPEPAPEPGMLSRVYFFLSARKHKRVKHPLSDSLATLLRHETQRLIQENPDLMAGAGADETISLASSAGSSSSTASPIGSWFSSATICWTIFPGPMSSISSTPSVRPAVSTHSWHPILSPSPSSPWDATWGCKLPNASPDPLSGAPRPPTKRCMWPISRIPSMRSTGWP
ncbi:PHP domain-containing protein [Desulfosarcina cetonica]|uniref:PHP domain-containing protein n=1 Tax=Desulfosarcina cetonica TaxID=90730 RepID=UPI000AE9C7D9|nr:hypothetical protein [Desulfosarcina cetonica]